MKNIAIIPARGGSKRLPDKNVALLGGIPLIAHSILYARKNSGIVDEVYVTTDSDTIRTVALEYGAQVINRPAALSGDMEPTVTALKHCIESISFEAGNVFLLQPTNPLRPAGLLSEAYSAYMETGAAGLMTVTRDYSKLGRITGSRFLPFNYLPGQRSQDLEPLYFENGLLYISRAEQLRQGTIISEDTLPFIVDHAFAQIDIDTQHGLDYAAFLLQKSTGEELR